jgi:chromosome segregation ATPase
MKPSMEAIEAADREFDSNGWHIEGALEKAYSIDVAPLEQRIEELESVNKNVMDVNMAFRERIAELERERDSAYQNATELDNHVKKRDKIIADLIDRDKRR